jgi:hypothetical protein
MAHGIPLVFSSEDDAAQDSIDRILKEAGPIGVSLIRRIGAVLVLPLRPVLQNLSPCCKMLPSTPLL